MEAVTPARHEGSPETVEQPELEAQERRLGFMINYVTHQTHVLSRGCCCSDACQPIIHDARVARLAASAPVSRIMDNS